MNELRDHSWDERTQEIKPMLVQAQTSRWTVGAVLLLFGAVVFLGAQIRSIKAEVNELCVWQIATKERLDFHLGPYDFP